LSYVLEVDAISCHHGGVNVVDGLSFFVSPGDLACLLGPSGCGKTTVLRAIAGFHTVDSGSIRIYDQLVSSQNRTVAPERRQVGMVFQDYALFPHMTSGENVAAGLREISATQRADVVNETMHLIGIENLKQRYPHELSGGQQQRVALARALAPNPHLLLMDEPFSSLDLELRERIGYELRDLLKQRGTTCILVTHDQFDAFALGDRVGVMHDGKIVQWDTPYNLYHEPATRFVADFIGEGVLLLATVLTPDSMQTEFGLIRGNRAYDWEAGTTVDLLIRPDDVVADPHSEIKAEVIRRAFKGAEIMYTLRLSTGGVILSLLPSHTDYDVGAQVGIRLQVDHMVAFAREADGR